MAKMANFMLYGFYHSNKLKIHIQENRRNAKHILSDIKAIYYKDVDFHKVNP